MGKWLAHKIEEHYTVIHSHHFNPFQGYPRKDIQPSPYHFPQVLLVFLAMVLYQISQKGPDLSSRTARYLFFVKVMARTLSLLSTPGHQRFFRLASASTTGQNFGSLIEKKQYFFYSGYHLTPHDLTQPGGV